MGGASYPPPQTATSRAELSRFMSYCTARGIDPTAVTPDTFVQFGKEVENFSLVRDPGGIYRDTCKIWNDAVRTIPGWPQLEVAVPNRRRDFALALDDFPLPFQLDVDTFLTRGAEPDVFSDTYHKPVGQTDASRSSALDPDGCNRIWSTAGVPISEDSLVLTHSSRTPKRHFGSFMIAPAVRRQTQIYQIATLLKTIARHHLQLPEKIVDALRKLCKALKPRNEGFTEKNRRCFANSQTSRSSRTC